MRSLFMIVGARRLDGSRLTGQQNKLRKRERALSSKQKARENCYLP